jgi:hypothetical protein
LRTEKVRALIEYFQTLAPCAFALTQFRDRNPHDLAVRELCLADLDWRVNNTVAVRNRILKNVELGELEIAEKLLDMVDHHTLASVDLEQAAAPITVSWYPLADEPNPLVVNAIPNRGCRASTREGRGSGSALHRSRITRGRRRARV